MICATVWLDIAEREASLQDVSTAFSIAVSEWTIKAAAQVHRIEVEREDA